MKGNGGLPRDYPHRYIACRDLKHAWNDEPDSLKRSFDHGRMSYKRALRCLRCTTLKHQTLAVDGKPIKPSHYSYPKGYLRPGVNSIEAAREARAIALRLAAKSPAWMRVVAKEARAS